jgi:hypothetical protein
VTFFRSCDRKNELGFHFFYIIESETLLRVGKVRERRRRRRRRSGVSE